MNHASALPLFLSRDDLRRFSGLDVPRGLIGVARQWLIISAAGAVAIWSGSWPVYLVAIAVIATRQHALAVLMHDGAHYLLHRDRNVNNIVSNLFLSFPLLVSTDRYRRHHLLHHRYLNSDRDPDRDDGIAPGRRRTLLLLLAADVVGLTAIRTLTTMSYFSVLDAVFKPYGSTNGLPPLEGRLAMAFFATVAVCVFAFGFYWHVLILWIVPMMSVLPPILRLRALAEHGACTGTNQLNSARTVDAGIVERMLFAPCNVNYHLEHHLYPSVPFYRLPSLSRRLREQPAFTSMAVLNTGYLVGDRSVLDDVAPMP
jgi:fatty acid desaturase